MRNASRSIKWDSDGGARAAGRRIPLSISAISPITLRRRARTASRAAGKRDRRRGPDSTVSRRRPGALPLTGAPVSKRTGWNIRAMPSSPSCDPGEQRDRADNLPARPSRLPSSSVTRTGSAGVLGLASSLAAVTSTAPALAARRLFSGLIGSPYGRGPASPRSPRRPRLRLRGLAALASACRPRRPAPLPVHHAADLALRCPVDRQRAVHLASSRVAHGSMSRS